MDDDEFADEDFCETCYQAMEDCTCEWCETCDVEADRCSCVA